MKRSFHIKIMQTVCAILCLCIVCSAFLLCASAASVQNYTVTVDKPVGVTAKNMPAVLKDVQNGTNPVLHVAGWIQTDMVIKEYEYTMDGGKTWIRSKEAVQPRPDTQRYNPTTYQTAGFSLDIDVSDLERGTYDLFVRAYTDQNDVIDVLAMLNVTIGHVDKITMTYHELNLRAFGAKGGLLNLASGQKLMLDAYNLREFQSFEVLLDQDAELTLQSAPSSVMTLQKTFHAEKDQDGNFVATVSLTDVQYAGKLTLQSNQDVKISRIRFYTDVPDYYQGELAVHMAYTPYEYLSGANAVDATVLDDETVGTHMRLYPTVDTNDPFIYFNLGKYLKETREGMQINADHYRYMVITLQTPSTNSKGLFRLFLCAGEIHGPSGDSHVAFQPKNDGKWHKYVVPLCEEEHWTGSVYGMRFDFIDGNVTTSDYANIASLAFFPDVESANQAAAMPFEVYHEQGVVQDPYKEEGRAPSGKADAVTWFDQSLADCFSGENKSTFRFDEYGHLILQATEMTNDPFVSFSLGQYAAKTGLPTLRAEEYGVIVLRVYADKNIDGKGFTLYYYSGGKNFAQGERSVTTMYEGGKWEYLVYEMAGKTDWTDEILGMRLDFAQQINAGQRVCLSDMLFFKDKDAWKAYAKENGIPVETDDPPEIETRPTAPETEIPTIEIPTEGAGLEYIPSDKNQQTQNNASCQSTFAVPVCIMLSLAAVTLIKNKTKKGDQL
ncbi:MAG: hypothetical protein IIU63_07610 [Clostridia bacterium]|nr:hypothetical protein [Clostridia bacterium]